MTDFPSADFSWTAQAAPARLMAILNEVGEARYVGGCVRDSLIGLPPGTKGRTDIDIATTLTPDRTMEVLEAAGIRNIPTGIEHGTVTAVIDHIPYEITTLRADVETDGRRAVVAYTTEWREDAERRDFTINALYLDHEGQITDFFEGQKNLTVGKVRFIGSAEQRIKEDYLRILRFLRFSARFSDQLDETGWQASVALKDGIDSLSRERIWNETSKLFRTRSAPVAISMAAMDGVLEKVCTADAQPAFFTQLHALRGEDITDAEGIAALWPAADRATLKSAFRPSTETLNDVETLKAASGAILAGKGPRHILYMAGRRLGIEAAYLASAEIADEVGTAYLEALEVEEIPVLPFKGADFIALGVPKGPKVSAAQRRFEAGWIEARFPTDDATLTRLAQKAIEA